MRRVFSHIRQVNLWQSAESASGRGSELACTETIRSTLPRLFEKLGVRSMIDAPCGDFNWMRYVPLDGITYTGIDVVPELIERNQRNYGTDLIQFVASDITEAALPAVDLIMCRDGLVHLPLRDGCRALQNFKTSGSRYLLATTYPNTVQNRDTPVGSWRALNLLLPPFNLPEPLMLFSDPSDDTGANPDKSIGLWSLEAIDPVVPRWHSLSVNFTNFVRRYFNPSWKL